MRSKRYERAIERNLAELQHAILNRTTLVGIEGLGRTSSIFLQVTYKALFNDYVAHCIKVFERSSQAASFWYIYRTDQLSINRLAKLTGVSIDFLENMSGKLKHIRDLTHFHIDANGVLDPKAVWRKAGLKGKDLSRAVDACWFILTELQKSLSLKEVHLPTLYTSERVKKITETVENK